MNAASIILVSVNNLKECANSKNENILFESDKDIVRIKSAVLNCMKRLVKVMLRLYIQYELYFIYM